MHPLGNLRRPQTVHAQRKYFLHDCSGFLVDYPFLFVLWVFLVPIGRDGCKVFTRTALGLPCGPDFLLVSLAYISLNTLRMAVNLLSPAHCKHFCMQGGIYEKLL